MQKSQFLILTLAIFIIAMGCLSTQTNDPANKTEINQNAQQINLGISIFNGTATISQKLTVQKGISALEAFEKVAKPEYKKYPFGSYVYAVNGLRENTGNDGKYWQYYVNGKIVMVAVDKYTFNSDAKLEFRYEKQNPEIK